MIYKGAITDNLVDNPVKGYQPMTDMFLNESILSILTKEEQSNRWMYFDVVVNVHRSGIGPILVSPAGAHYHVTIKLRFPYTNNMAKHEVALED